MFSIFSKVVPFILIMLPAIICGVLGRPLTGLEKAIIDNNFIINKAMETKFKRKKNVIVRTRGLYLLIRLLDISTIVALVLLDIRDIMTYCGHLRLDRFSRAEI